MHTLASAPDGSVPNGLAVATGGSKAAPEKVRLVEHLVVCTGGTQSIAGAVTRFGLGSIQGGHVSHRGMLLRNYRSVECPLAVPLYLWKIIFTAAPVE